MKPLNFCVLRTARLASVEGAKFGLTRRNADGTKRPHQGIDLVAVPSTNVLAIANGLIVGINFGADGYGYTLTLKFEVDGKILFAFYAHLSKVFCKVGDKVKAGELIAKTGSTGNARGMDSLARGSHLHFEIRTKQLVSSGLDGRIDPLKYIELDT